jgi:hypothetical protein
MMLARWMLPIEFGHVEAGRQSRITGRAANHQAPQIRPYFAPNQAWASAFLIKRQS